LLDVGEQSNEERDAAELRRRRETRLLEAGREAPVDAVVVVCGQAQLLQIVGALQAGGGLADLLDGGQEQADEDGDDGDHHQQLDQRESDTMLTACCHGWNSVSACPTLVQTNRLPAS
jgi:hypothetical protein